MATESLSSAHSDLNQETKGEYRGTFAGPDESKVPESFVWPDDLKGSQEVPVLNVPHIDLNKFLSGNESDVEEVTRLVDEACRKHGFFVVVNHGVDMKVMESLHECMSEFFSMPMDVKQRAHRKFGENFGYAYSFFVRFSSNLPWKETLSLPCVADGENSSSAYDYLIEKLGPTFSHHGKVYQDCAKAVNDLGMKILEVLGLSLGVSREYFKNFYEDNDSIMRLNYYPPCSKPELVLGTGPHCDPTSITILHQDKVSGFQVCVDDQWYSIPPTPDSFVINIGDTFKSLTNGIYKSCVHRAVVNSENVRKTMAFFICPNHDKVVRAPEELVEKNPPRKYPDYTWGTLLEITQKHYRPDCNTLEALTDWIQKGKPLDNGSTITAPSA